MLGNAILELRDGLLSLAYPERCRVCGSAVESWDDGVVCERCWTDPAITVFFTGKPSCFKCGAPPATRNLDPRRAQAIADGRPSCGSCASLPFAAARACGAYSGGLHASVIFLKSQPHLCGRLRRYILQTFAESREALTSDIVIPVPLHRSRKRERGFNQAAIIAKAISSGCGIPLDLHSLARVKYTELHRAGMDSRDRARSVERAFKVLRPRLINDATVLVVDDLYTTGSTISAVSSAMLEAGAKRVNVLTVARALPQKIALPNFIKRDRSSRS